MTLKIELLNHQLKLNRLQIGDNKVFVIDDFLLQPEAMRQAATQSQFDPYPGYSDKKGYPGIRAKAPEDYSYTLTTFLEPFLKREFNVPAELDIRKSICAFSLMTMKPQELGPLQLTPHFDASTPYHTAVLLYLCDHTHGGTAFYRHNSTGLERISATNREHYLDIYYQELNHQRPQQQYYADSTELFTKIGMVQARFNRLVIYQGSILHAPYINADISIDSNPATGRLTLNSFFDF